MKRNGRLDPARTPRRVRIADVARTAGVSISTVSRVVNGLDGKASPDTVARVRAAVAKLDYRPARVGRALRTAQTQLVALLTPDTSNAFYAAIAHSIEGAMAGTGHAMILCNTREDPAVQDHYLEEMEAQMVRGIALLGAVDSPGLRRAARRGLPIVFVNRKPPAGVDGPFVGIDNRRAGREIADHFLERGFRPCGAIHGPLTSSASRERFEGYRDRLAEAGAPLDPDLVRGAQLTMQSGYANAHVLLQRDKRPRAIFCGNDLIAYGAFRRCRELGLAVPDDLALFGFDDNPLNEWIAPWLSTVHVPCDVVGPLVMSAMERLWSAGARGNRGQTAALVPHRVVLRSSA
ncbi:MAG: LacI family DNA-binding transcriptional regulator [Rhodospirillaceae bacterium]|nr:LacI family DNA-binding transcriptional regulator [Rhodospirillaceae bacterium]